MQFHKLDQIDILILQIIQKRARIKRKDLAELVHLTIPAVSERMRKMQEEGYIKKYTTVLDPKKVHLGVTAFIFIKVDTSSHYSDVITQALKYSEILECHAITGAGSHLLKVRTMNVDGLEKLLGIIQSWDGVINTKTNLVLSSPKESTELSLDHLFSEEKEQV